MKMLLACLLVVSVSGCALKYNAVIPETEVVDKPAVGVVTKAEVGDHLLTKGLVIKEDALLVKTLVDGILYDITPGQYPIFGMTDNEKFFVPSGVVRSGLADPYQAVSVRASNPQQVCVVTTYAARACYDADIEIVPMVSAKQSSFQQTLIYSGRVGNKINIGYREFSSSLARPAFNNDVEYDLSASKQIGYKGALLEVINADNTSITYRVLRSFQ